MPNYMEKKHVSDIFYNEGWTLITDSQNIDALLEDVGLDEDDNALSMGALFVKYDELDIPSEIWGCLSRVPEMHKPIWCLFGMEDNSSFDEADDVEE